jgi:hypothetical protein
VREVLDSPRFWLYVHGIRTLAWMVMLPVSFVTGWASAIPYVTALSIWALVETAAGNWQSARAEVRAQRAEKAAEDGQGVC